MLSVLSKNGLKMLSFNNHKLWLCLDEKIDYSKHVSKEIHHLVNISAKECFKCVTLSTKFILHPTLSMLSNAEIGVIVNWAAFFVKLKIKGGPCMLVAI